MKYVEYFRQEICDGELCDAMMSILLISFAASIMVTCVSSLT